MDAAVALLKPRGSFGIILGNRRVKHLLECDAHSLRDCGRAAHHLRNFRHAVISDYRSALLITAAFKRSFHRKLILRPSTTLPVRHTILRTERRHARPRAERF